MPWYLALSPLQPSLVAAQALGVKPSTTTAPPPLRSPRSRHSAGEATTVGMASEKCRNTELARHTGREAGFDRAESLSPDSRTSCGAVVSGQQRRQRIACCTSKTCSRTFIVMVCSRLAWKKALMMTVPFIAWRRPGPRRTRHDDETAQHKHSLICRPAVDNRGQRAAASTQSSRTRAPRKPCASAARMIASEEPA